MTWKQDNAWESSWWGNCQSTCYAETTKQIKEYAPKMGLNVYENSQGPHIKTFGNILDVGGGPCSMLLLAEGWERAYIVDPCDYPEWTFLRYENMGINLIKDKGENISNMRNLNSIVFDEVWMYNVLQHVEDPEKIVSNIRKISRIIRVFDWLEIGVGAGHPQNLTEEKMNEWFGGYGKVNEARVGKDYSGIFLGDHFEKRKV